MEIKITNKDLERLVHGCMIFMKHTPLEFIYKIRQGDIFYNLGLHENGWMVKRPRTFFKDSWIDIKYIYKCILYLHVVYDIYDDEKSHMILYFNVNPLKNISLKEYNSPWDLQKELEKELFIRGKRVLKLYLENNYCKDIYYIITSYLEAP